MAYVNMKTFVLASMKPLIVAFKGFYDRQLDTANTQITSHSSVLTDHNNKLEEHTTQLASIDARVTSLEDNSVSITDYNSIIEENKRLNHIVKSLYDLMSDMITNQAFPATDTVLPNYTDPFISKAVLESEFRKAYGLDETVTLTAVQQARLANYINAYLEAHPDKTLTD